MIDELFRSLSTELLSTRVKINISEACRFGLGLVFFVSGIYKLIDPVAFRIPVAHMGVSSGALYSAAVSFIPVLKIAIGIMLASAVMPAIAGGAAIAITGVFSAALVRSHLITGQVADCGCFPFPEPATLGYYLVRNGVLIIIAVVVCVAAVANRAQSRN